MRVYGDPKPQLDLGDDKTTGKRREGGKREMRERSLKI